MPSKHDPVDSLTDVIDNAERIAGYITGINRDEFERNGLVRDAVERCVERICEAAFRLGNQAEGLMPDQPWEDVLGMGNRLRHAYHRINLEIMWATATSRVPELKFAAQKALADLQTDGADPT